MPNEDDKTWGQWYNMVKWNKVYWLGIWKMTVSSATNEQQCDLEQVTLCLWALVLRNVKITQVNLSNVELL